MVGSRSTDQVFAWDAMSAAADSRAAVAPRVNPALVRVVIGFLRHEVSLAAGLFADLSAALTAELASLAAARSGYADSAARMNQALQREDLIQQRLADLDAALRVLDGAFEDAGRAGPCDDLGARVAAVLRLGETRLRLLRRLNGQAGALAEPASEPRVGEVDLF